MRSATIIAIACLLVLVGTVSAAGSQAAARAIEDRWKNCSQIVRGRLGAIYPTADDVFAFENLVFGTYTVNLYPCLANSFGNFVTIDSLGYSETYNQIYTTDNQLIASPKTTDARLITFTMPDKVGQVAQITAKYLSNGGRILTLTALCNASATKPLVTSLNVTGSTTALTITTVQACARFPYTNKSMPPGGIAALIVVIVCFVLQMGACFKYHKDNKGHSPLDGDQM